MNGGQIVDKIERLINNSNASDNSKSEMLEWLREMAVMCGAGRKYK